MLTWAQMAVLGDAKLRCYPYSGYREAIDTGLWFDEFIKPASDDKSLRLVPMTWLTGKHWELQHHNYATIVKGNPWNPMTYGKGIFHNVRTGAIPLNPVKGALWRGKDTAVTEDDMRKRFIQGQKELHYQGWMAVTMDLLSRGLIKPTKPIQMLTGHTAITP